MSHIHNIVDADKRFIIQPAMRRIITESSEIILSKGDHNSERYTFEIPRMLEGHDMNLCNRVEIHYDNISKNRTETSKGFYVVNDLAVDGDNVIFSWLISRNVTRLAGNVQFSINFRCIDEDGDIVYSWSTDVYKSITVIDNNRNTEEVIKKFPDVLLQWKDEILDEINTSGLNHITYLESPDDNQAIVYVRDLKSGVYILNGTFKLSAVHTETLLFPIDTFVSISKTNTTSYVQILSVKDSTIRYLEITDRTAFSKDVALVNVPSEDRVSEMIYEALGVIENGSY